MIDKTTAEYIDRATGEMLGLLESDKFTKKLGEDEKEMANEILEILQTMKSFYDMWSVKNSNI